jgi:SAM-dependent methyltransferase
MSNLKLDDILITGRTYEEYKAFFNLDEKELIGKKVLDCPSGASSFIKTANEKGIKAKGADIIYQFDKDGIKTQGIKTIDQIYADTSWMDGFCFDFYGSIQNHKLYRQKALEGFYKDYNGFDYSYMELPKLRYQNDSFDLVLSSHLLFTYDDRFDYEFHKSSILEMLRIAKEVRLFPLVDFKNSNLGQEDNFSPFVYKIIKELKEYKTQIVKVDFEFQPRAEYMLKITK